MKILKPVLVTAALAVTVSSFAQFGATSKSDFMSGGNKQGTYASFSPFGRISGGGDSANGYVLSFEKMLDSGSSDSNVFGAWFGNFSNNNIYQFHLRKTFSETMDIQFGLLGGDGTGNKTDFSILAFAAGSKASEVNALSTSLFGGIYYAGVNKKASLQAGIRASYPMQNGLSIDGTFWYVADNPNRTLISVGLGYRF
jgi:hypothetical protein